MSSPRPKRVLPVLTGVKPWDGRLRARKSPETFAKKVLAGLERRRQVFVVRGCERCFALADTVRLLVTEATAGRAIRLLRRLDAGELCDMRGTTGVECSELDATLRDLGATDPRFLALSRDLLSGRMNCK